MPWQLSGNGRSDWSTKLIRGLKAEAAAGFQSRRERCSEPTPATPQYAAFSTYKAARVHHLFEQLQPLGSHGGLHSDETSDVSSRLRKARDKAAADRIGNERENDWNGACLSQQLRSGG